jgi:hypothetical protein
LLDPLPLAGKTYKASLFTMRPNSLRNHRIKTRAQGRIDGTRALG